MRRGLLVCAFLFCLLASSAHAETIKYRFGPIHIAPGRNDNLYVVNDKRPPVDGWITCVQARTSRTPTERSPRVDVIHLHHGVWAINGAPTFAAGEEKTSDPGAGRLRLALPHERSVAAQPHDPQPHAERDRRLRRLRDRVHPGHVARGGRDTGGPDAVARRDGRDVLPGVRRAPARRRARRALHVPRRVQAAQRYTRNRYGVPRGWRSRGHARATSTPEASGPI